MRAASGSVLLKTAFRADSHVLRNDFGYRIFVHGGECKVQRVNAPLSQTESRLLS